MKARLTIHILFALALLAVLTLFVVTDPAPPAQAETRDQMQQRVLQEMLQQHPDVVAGCDAGCVQNWLAGAPWLKPLAERNRLPVDDVVKAAISFNYEWGIQFERLYGRPPTNDDWQFAYTSNGEAFRAKFDATPVLFAVDTWTENRYFRMKQEYCQRDPRCY